MKEGDDMVLLFIFSNNRTPNQYRIASEYLLMDNNYHVSEKSSAEGYHWASVRMVTGYTEERASVDS
jgi:hypothetical protein